MTPTLVVTPAEWWELQARGKDVETARLRLVLAEAQLAEAQRRVMAAHGADPTGNYDVVRDDGPLPSALGSALTGESEARRDPSTRADPGA